MNSFSRRTWAFYEDHLIARINSLTFEHENEIRYETIKAIQHQRSMDSSWLWVTFVIIGILGMLKLSFGYFGMIIPGIALIEKVVVIAALVFALPSFRKHDMYIFLDSDRDSLAKILAAIRVGKKNKAILLDAIQLIRQNNDTISETHLGTLLPSTPPVYQFTELDIPDFFNRSTVRFYEDRLVDVEKSLMEEVTTVIQYDELAGKTKIARMGNNNWDTVACYWLIFVCITTVSTFVFFPQYIAGNVLFFRILLGAFLLLIPLFLLKYIKSEILIFYNKKEEGVYWTRINAANREKLKEVIRFVEDKVLARAEKPA